MKLKFKVQPYQTQAVNAVVDAGDSSADGFDFGLGWPGWRQLALQPLRGGGRVHARRTAGRVLVDLDPVPQGVRNELEGRPADRRLGVVRGHNEADRRRQRAQGHATGKVGPTGDADDGRDLLVVG